MENKRSNKQSNFINKQWIAMDDIPFPISYDQGSIDLLATLKLGYLISTTKYSTKYSTDTMLPQTFEILKIKLQTKLSKATFLSFTNEI